MQRALRVRRLMLPLVLRWTLPRVRQTQLRTRRLLLLPVRLMLPLALPRRLPELLMRLAVLPKRPLALPNRPIRRNRLNSSNCCPPAKGGINGLFRPGLSRHGLACWRKGRIIAIRPFSFAVRANSGTVY